MINFRFHVVSLIAVFLALALGIVIGSTVVDDGIVGQLRKEIRSAESRSDEVEAENDRLKDELGRLDAYIEDTGPFTADARLAGVPVAVVALRGVDGDAVDDTLGLLRAAGASLPGVIWLEDDWLLEGDAAARLAETLGDNATGDLEALRGEGLRRLAERLASRPAGPSTTTTTRAPARTTTTEGTDATGVTETTETTETTEPGDVVDLVELLDEEGFVAVERDDSDADLAAFPSGLPRALVIGGPHAELRDVDLLTAAVRAFDAAGVPTVAAEVYADDEDGPDRGVSVAAVRDDDALAATVSTLDDLDLPEGRVTALLALDGLGDGIVGHYGYGSGAKRSLPEWTGP